MADSGCQAGVPDGCVARARRYYENIDAAPCFGILRVVTCGRKALPACQNGQCHIKLGPMLDLLKVIVPVVVIGIGVLYFFQDALIFFPQPTPADSRVQFESHASECAEEEAS